MRNTFSSMAMGCMALLCLIGCNSNQIKINNKNFEAEISQQQNLVFTLNKDLAPDSLIDRWDTTPYIKFTPEVRGKFKWASKNELIFSPDIGFQASTRYDAELQKEVIKVTKTSYSLSSKKIEFHTPLLNVSAIKPFWTLNQAGQAELHALLTFNYKIKPEALAPLLAVQAAQKTVAVKVLSTQAAEQIEILVSVPNNAQEFTLEIKPGLTTTQSGFKTEKPLIETVIVPDRKKLDILEAKANYENTEGYIHVETNQSLTANQISAFVSLERENTTAYIAPEEEKLVFETEILPNGFNLKGNFFPGNTYQLTIGQNIKGVAGGILTEDYQQTIAFGNMQPQIAFTEPKAIYLTSKGSKNIGVRITGVPKVKVGIYKIFENNLQAFLRAYQYQLESENGYFYGDDFNLYGAQISEQEYNTNRLPYKNGMYLLDVSTQELSQFKGAYAVTISSPEEQWMKSIKLIAVSDIGLIAKSNTEETTVFVNSIQDTKSMAGVKVQMWSTNNQVLSSQITTEEGLVKFIDMHKKYPNFKLSMITAHWQNDFTFLMLESNRVETSQYEVGGLRSNTAYYQAFIHPERDLYRPGETIHLATIVRNNQWQPVAKMPIKLRAVLPNGKEMAILQGNLSEQGSWESALALPASAPTGTYHLEIYTSTDVLLNTLLVNVEEFMPDRIKINQSLDHKEYSMEDSIAISGQALNLFGPPAAKRNYEINFELQPMEFKPKAFKEYNFSIQGKQENNFYPNRREGLTDEQGKFEEIFQVSEAFRGRGIFNARLFTTVFDESGRPVHKTSQAPLYTQNVFLGIKNFSTYTDVLKELSVDLVALNKNEQPVKSQALFQIIQYEWQNVLERNYEDGVRYVSQRKEKVLEEKSITINKNLKYKFMPRRSGEYEIRVYVPGSPHYVSQSFYAYGYDYTDYTSFEVNKAGRIDIEANQEKFTVGQTAKLLFKTPFEGKLLLTIEREKILEHHYLETKNKACSFDLKITDTHLPNIYISATLIKPLSQGAIPLTVAHGYLPITIEDPKHQLPLEIIAAASSYSNTKQTVQVKSKPESDIEVTLAIVDEGILQIKNFASPNPHEYFFQKRALEVEGFDLYPRLFPELSKSSVGGDRELALSEADAPLGDDNFTNPLASNRVKLVSYWSGILKTDAQGIASYTFEIPQFSGSLRIMAVAHKKNRFSAASKTMKVADPIVITSGLPRFLTPNDEVVVPVTLANTTDKEITTKATAAASAELTLVGPTVEGITVPAHSERRVFFKFRTNQGLGNAQFTVRVNALGKSFFEKTDLPIRAAYPSTRKSGAGSLSAGNTKQLALGNLGFLEGSERVKLIVSNSPVTQFADNLDYLLQYPYGCVEQTVSSVFPQLYVLELSRQLKEKNKNFSGSSGRQSQFNIQEAIYKLQSMQLYNGALSYWPGYEQESWWGTAYAAHFLWEAKKAGYPVNQAFLNRIAEYLQKQVRNKQTERYVYYTASNGRVSKTIISKETAYSLYVLALMRQSDIATMNYCKANVSMLAIDSRYLLAATYLLLGDPTSYQQILPKSFSGERSIQALSGSFYSYIRDEAISLNALLEADPRSPQIPIMAKHLSEQIKIQNNYLNTQEAAFSLLALGKLAKQANQGNVTASVKADGKVVGNFVKNDLVLDQNIAGKTLSINASGTGTVYYNWLSRGILKEFKEQDNFLKVRKSIYNRAGQMVGSTTFNQNDLLVIKITLQTADGTEIPNVAITDLLPAGFEIENPRLVEAASMPWIKDANTPDYLDIRDDRIHIFTSANQAPKNFYFMVRAVSLGKFSQGPVSAEAMYNFEYFSYFGAKEINVVSKQNEVVAANR